VKLGHPGNPFFPFLFHLLTCSTACLVFYLSPVPLFNCSPVLAQRRLIYALGGCISLFFNN